MGDDAQNDDALVNGPATPLYAHPHDPSCLQRKAAALGEA